MATKATGLDYLEPADSAEEASLERRAEHWELLMLRAANASLRKELVLARHELREAELCRQELETLCDTIERTAAKEPPAYRLRLEGVLLGEHVHARLLCGLADEAPGLAGEIVLRQTEWEAIRRGDFACELVDETAEEGSAAVKERTHETVVRGRLAMYEVLEPILGTDLARERSGNLAYALTDGVEPVEETCVNMLRRYVLTDLEPVAWRVARAWLQSVEG